MSAFDNLGTIQAQRVWDGIAGRSVHGERLTLGVIELDPNGVVPEHSHDNEQLGICLSGSLVFRVGGESRELRPGDTWSIPPNVPHDVRVGPDGAVVIDVFAPPREDWRNLPPLEARPRRWPGPQASSG